MINADSAKQKEIVIKSLTEQNRELKLQLIKMVNHINSRSFQRVSVPKSLIEGEVPMLITGSYPQQQKSG